MTAFIGRRPAAYGVIDKVRGTLALHGTKGAVYRRLANDKRTPWKAQLGAGARLRRRPNQRVR